VITVANLRNTTDGFRCDRLSALGNPFVLMARNDTAGRADAVTAYGLYLHLIANEGFEPVEAIERVKARQKPGQRMLIVASTPKSSRDSFMVELGALTEKHLKQEPVTLLCWCAPLPCHCDRIADYLNWLHPSEGSHV
jgi:Domain of unknown function (DUF4326)